MASPMTEVLNGILRAVRQPTTAKMATGFELGKLLSQNELQRSVCQPRPIRPNVLDRIVTHFAFVPQGFFPLPLQGSRHQPVLRIDGPVAPLGAANLVS